MSRLGSLLLVLLAAACSPMATPPPGYAGDDARDFVKKHRVALEKEIGIGSGPRLYDLAILADCRDVPRLGRRLHRNQGALFAPGAEQDEVLAERMVKFMQDNKDLRCISLESRRDGDFAAGRRFIGPSRGQVALSGGL